MLDRLVTCGSVAHLQLRIRGSHFWGNVVRNRHTGETKDVLDTERVGQQVVRLKLMYDQGHQADHIKSSNSPISLLSIVSLHQLPVLCHVVHSCSLRSASRAPAWQSQTQLTSTHICPSARHAHSKQSHLLLGTPLSYLHVHVGAESAGLVKATSR